MDLYREEILEHWQNPLNFGVLKDADLIVEEVNQLCGDEITLYVRMSAEKRGTKNAELRRIKDVRFTSSGCAISTASASMLSEEIRGKTVSEISKMTGKDVLKLIGADSSFPPARLKCAFLALEAVKKIRIMN